MSSPDIPPVPATAPAAPDLDWFRAFVAGWPWRFARTYVESYPHEYTLERQGSSADFARAIECIERWGVVERFYKEERKYLHVDGRKYWHMGRVPPSNPGERPDLINRTWLDVSRYRDEAARLGFDGERLDRLVERWKVLLERARQAPPSAGSSALC